MSLRVYGHKLSYSRFMQEHGKKKLDILSKTNDLRKVMNKIQWKNELLELQENHEKELYVDFQLMHLTNELKAVLNGETEVTSVNETQIEDQLSRQNGAYGAKVKKLLLEQNGFTKAIRERAKENVQLEKQLEMLRDTVKLKEQTFEVNGRIFYYYLCQHSMNSSSFSLLPNSN